MNGLMNWLEKYIIPVASKIGSEAIREVITSVGEISPKNNTPTYIAENKTTKPNSKVEKER